MKDDVNKIPVNEDIKFLVTNIELILDDVRTCSANSDKRNLYSGDEVSPRKNRISFLLNNSQTITKLNNDPLHSLNKLLVERE